MKMERMLSEVKPHTEINESGRVEIYPYSDVRCWTHINRITRGKMNKDKKKFASAFEGWHHPVHLVGIYQDGEFRPLDVFVRKANSGWIFHDRADRTEFPYLCDKMDMTQAEALYKGRYSRKVIEKLRLKYGKLLVRQRSQSYKVE